MAAAVIIAQNQTASPIDLEDVGVIVPASGNLTLTDELQVDEIMGSARLQDEVDLGNIVLNDGTDDIAASSWAAHATGAVAAADDAGPPAAQKVESTTTTTTTSGSFVTVAGMTITPAAGTYFVTFSTSGGNTTGGDQVRIGLAVDGVDIAETERRGDGAAFITVNTPLQTQDIITVDGTEEIQGRFRQDGGGTAQLFQRNLIIIQVS